MRGRRLLFYDTAARFRKAPNKGGMAIWLGRLNTQLTRLEWRRTLLMATGLIREARERFRPDSIVIRGRLSNVDGSFVLSRLRNSRVYLRARRNISASRSIKPRINKVQIYYSFFFQSSFRTFSFMWRTAVGMNCPPACPADRNTRSFARLPCLGPPLGSLACLLIVLALRLHRRRPVALASFLFCLCWDSTLCESLLAFHLLRRVEK